MGKFQQRLDAVRKGEMREKGKHFSTWITFNKIDIKKDKETASTLENN